MRAGLLHCGAAKPLPIRPLWTGVRYGHAPRRDDLMGLYEARAQKAWPRVSGDSCRPPMCLRRLLRCYYLRAQKVRTLIGRILRNPSSAATCLLTRRTPSQAFAIGQRPTIRVHVLKRCLTVTVKLAGTPAISVHYGLSHDGLHLGLPSPSHAFDEATVRERARYETARNQVHPSSLVEAGRSVAQRATPS